MDEKAYRALKNYFKTYTAMAQYLEVDKTTVSKWRKRGCPPYYALRIERATRGAVRAIQLVAENHIGIIEEAYRWQKEPLDI